MNRLAIDAGPTATGYAIERDNEIVRFGTRRFRDVERGRHPDWESECADLYATWLTYLVRQEQISEIMVEETIQGGVRSPELRWVNWAHVSTAVLCRRLQLAYRPFYQSEMKKFATGYGRARPRDMIAAAKRRGYDVQTDHEADAIFALLMSGNGAMPGPLGSGV